MFQYFFAIICLYIFFFWMRKTVFLKDRRSLNKFTFDDSPKNFIEKPKNCRRPNRKKEFSSEKSKPKTQQISEEKPKTENKNYLSEIKQQYPLFNEVFETKLSLTPLNQNNNNEEESSSEDLFIQPISFDPNIAAFNETLESHIEEQNFIEEEKQKEAEENKIDNASLLTPQINTEFYFLGYEYKGMQEEQNDIYSEYADVGFEFSYDDYINRNEESGDEIQSLKQSLVRFREDIKEMSRDNAKDSRFACEETGFTFITERQSPLMYRKVLVPKQKPSISLYPKQYQGNQPRNTQSKWNTFGTQNKFGSNQNFKKGKNFNNKK